LWLLKKLVEDMNKTVMLRLRVEPEFKQQLQNAIAEGKAESMSELIRKAVNKFLETQNQT